jgi:hypothetical protein
MQSQKVKIPKNRLIIVFPPIEKEAKTISFESSSAVTIHLEFCLLKNIL